MDSHQGRDLVVIAASAGGVEPLRTLVARLPPSLPAAVLVVLHVASSGSSALAGILDRAGPLKAAPAEDGRPLVRGEVRVAVADHHLLVHDDHQRVSRGPRYNGYRPAADLLFMSAAVAAGPRVAGVVLSGTLDDGAHGCARVEGHGGVVAVQDPEECAFPGMPSAALRASERAETLPAARLAEWIVEQTRSPVIAEETMADDELLRDLARYLTPRLPTTPPEGELSGFTCPDCSGPLYARPGDPDPRYDCRVGHSWSMETMIAGQSDAVERALWVAVLRLEERGRLLQRMIRSAEDRGRRLSVVRLAEEADQTREALETMRIMQARLSTRDDVTEA
ncbi:chemotaxis protein CheB [Herbidospora sp. NBRC 101105]|uniref:chemotaxis protein CheB n=1 Tax=Herbidospora sp. NBRC 101105 TaxID=3032195 RepID=UPI0024A2C144|nr:chemotaxis protein CheB [Herbidospora sp. NBRC 101105]GLX96918.1 chemotaxis protein CheB [Herbidospora sp. NBRC 101105]